MPASRAGNLSSLFRTAVKSKAKDSAATAASKASAVISQANDSTLIQFVSSLGVPSSSTASHSAELSAKSPQNASLSKKNYLRSDIDSAIRSLETESHTDESAKQLSREISSILCGDISLDSASSLDPELCQSTNDEKSMETILDIPWFSNLPRNNISLRRKEVSRERKQKWIFKNTQSYRFERLVRMCACKVGADATLKVFGKLGRETGVKEYNALIGLCIEKARSTNDEDVSLGQIYNAFQLFKSMREQGFQLEEETYGPFLMFLIDMGMIEEFHFFCGIIKNENPSSLSRLGYYEMLLWTRVNNKEKIQELCDYIAVDDDGDKANIRENYLSALCESDRKEEILQVLEVIDITKISSVDHVACIFKSLGRLSLESFAEKFILALKASDYGTKKISCLILDYAVCMPNLAVEDVILKFRNLHAKVEVTPSSISYEKLITYCCDLLKVHMAFDIVDQLGEAGITLSTETLNSMLHACEESCEFNLVRRIYSLIHQHNLKPNNETFRSMINLSVRMKDFDGAYAMLNDLEKMNLKPTAGMYNAIMAGYFREKKIYGGLKVLKQMKAADVKPDSQTFSYLIGNCNCEEDIIKYFDELKNAGVQVTKHIFMSLINAYAACGQFEKAKQVVLDKGVPVKSLNEIKCVLVSALASNGKMSDAVSLYEEIKDAGYNLEPKAVISLIENFPSEGELSRLLQLLDGLDENDSGYWLDGYCRAILYCVRYKHLSSAIDLLKRLKDKFYNDEVATEVFFEEVFCEVAETESTDLQFGLSLLQAIKDELGLQPSRKCLDFLLTACVNAKDLHSSQLIWKEYQSAGLPYNVLSYLRFCWLQETINLQRKCSIRYLKMTPMFVV
ncbi:pentatricopeptide repeat-containing protein At4g04790, mitochondrial-like isoform X2 [Malania oleifera]|uniref:pentatricopeptide repeat-containing protein At4g04790, mitochondrial-like isoform X2 n=1 Tax=Malania oleifera TaxID=397392 RepID=UPI0025AE74DD|nr:pentatricopeptide repeat-containing protein At4g04790, mitochondrial-like isoform X2 [Malania oleifera]